VATRKKPFRLNVNLLAKALSAASMRKNGLILKIAKRGGVEVKGFLMKIISEPILVKRKDRRLVILVGGCELRICGDKKNETLLHLWAKDALSSQNGDRILYGNPSLLFDLY
jgi:hypothetical protein